MLKLTVHFFGPGTDLLSKFVSLAGRIKTGHKPHYTHVAISIEGDEGTLYHYTLGGVEQADMLDLLHWAPYHDSIDIETYLDYDAVMYILWTLQVNGKGTTLRGLLDLMFDVHNDRDPICTDIVNMVRGDNPYILAATPDELYNLLAEAY